MMVDKSYLSAITRNDISAPLKAINKKCLESTGWDLSRWINCNGLGNILDYGCGKGEDADWLKAEKYDPYYFPKKPIPTFKWVFCTYVLNVLDKKERLEVLKELDRMVAEGGFIFVTVRRDIKPREIWERDGYCQYYVPEEELTGMGYRLHIFRKNHFEIYKKRYNSL